ncbi:hypothetical protein VNO77_22434 [Canavalia gladiata]|uniref:Uncharacterized protein n=1 Tax=Canavalia gladiata TaxID=3824 RepID=A0AAN9L2L1_CANGL
MNGYSKISSGTGSMDFISLPQTPKASANKREDNDEGVNGERFGVILGRSGSVSSASGFQATFMKRAFSMRRSSSVSERIHNHRNAVKSRPL